MMITTKQVYAIAGLKVGDSVRIMDYSIGNPFILLKDSMQDKMNDNFSIELLLNHDFEKVENEIWDIKDIERGDKYYYLNMDLAICIGEYNNSNYENERIKNGIIFKEYQYIQEYKEKLIKFNKNYKKECK